MENLKTQLSSISPIDGRYRYITSPLSRYFSEASLFNTRIEIEIKYLFLLSTIGICRKFTRKESAQLENIYVKFSLQDAIKIKQFEQKTRHDVKAVEYFIRSKIGNSSLKNILVWVHFGLTSADINDNAYRLMIKRALEIVFIPKLIELTKSIKKIGRDFIHFPMLARTHGQPAIPTTFGKEMLVFYERLNKECNNLKGARFYGKFGGAVGNWNSLDLTFPKLNWPRISKTFLKSLDLNQTRYTTQIAPSEDLISIFQNISRLNGILIDFNQDLWRYVSDDWVVQKGKEGFVGSSTMPQKINPIEFENSEGNLVLANGIFETLSRKLSVSRLQRDLSDSTVFRNIGVAFAHSLISYLNCIEGISTISPNKQKVLKDLNKDWSILSEAIQTILRKNGKEDAYETISKIVKGKVLKKEDYLRIVSNINVSCDDKEKLLKLTPEKYIGLQ